MLCIRLYKSSLILTNASVYVIVSRQYTRKPMVIFYQRSVDRRPILRRHQMLIKTRRSCSLWDPSFPSRTLSSDNLPLVFWEHIVVVWEENEHSEGSSRRRRRRRCLIFETRVLPLLLGSILHSGLS